MRHRQANESQRTRDAIGQCSRHAAWPPRTARSRHSLSGGASPAGLSAVNLPRNPEAQKRQILHCPRNRSIGVENRLPELSLRGGASPPRALKIE